MHLSRRGSTFKWAVERQMRYIYACRRSKYTYIPINQPSHVSFDRQHKSITMHSLISKMLITNNVCVWQTDGFCSSKSIFIHVFNSIVFECNQREYCLWKRTKYETAYMSLSDMFRHRDFVSNKEHFENILKKWLISRARDKRSLSFENLIYR